MAEQSRRFVSLDKPIDKFIEDQKKQEHSFKDTQRCKFADWVSQLQKWKQKNEEILPKELNEYLSEFIVAARRKDSEDLEPSSLRGPICSFNRVKRVFESSDEDSPTQWQTKLYRLTNFGFASFVISIFN